MTTTTKNKLFHVRLTPALLAKLTGLATAVQKPRSAVVRALVLRATVADLPAPWSRVTIDEQAELAEVE